MPVVGADVVETRKRLKTMQTAGLFITSHWLVFTVTFSYAPLLIKFLVGKIFEPTFSANEFIGEIMFAVIVISAETAHVIYSERKGNRGDAMEFLLLVSFWVSLAFIALAAVFYGAMLLEELSQEGTAWRMAIVMAAASFLIGLSIQMFFAGREREVYAG